MKKFNSQAERHSNQAGAPRTSPAQLYFFLFIHRLQAQAPRTTELTRLMCKFFFLFFNRLQAQADPGPGRTHIATEARATVIFVDFLEYPI